MHIPAADVEVQLSANYRELLEPLRQLCASAGTAILSHYHSEQADAHEAKADKSPLTAAGLSR